jgi:saccharopine dehydrogenase-like NADP-dependent oxidoreductase
MKNILVIGAGKSSTCLIEYLLNEAAANNWQLTVADANLALAQSKTSNSPHAKAIALDVNDEGQRSSIVKAADIVISLLPPALHYLVAQDCLHHGRHLLTASYVDEKIQSLHQEIAAKGILFLPAVWWISPS